MMDPDTSHKRPSPPYRTSIQLREQAADSQSLPEDIPASSTVDHAYGSQEILKALSHTESDGEHLQNLLAQSI